MAAESSPSRTSDFGSTEITTIEDMSTEITQDRLHPLGPRAFSPEVRIKIFEFYYEHKTASHETQCNLLRAFREHDDLLYEEAVFFSIPSLLLSPHEASGPNGTRLIGTMYLKNANGFDFFIEDDFTVVSEVTKVV